MDSVGGGRSDEADSPADVEQVRARVREFGRQTPALARLIHAIRQDAEISELVGRPDTTGQRRSKARRGRSGLASRSLSRTRAEGPQTRENTEKQPAPARKRWSRYLGPCVVRSSTLPHA